MNLYLASANSAVLSLAWGQCPRVYVDRRAVSAESACHKRYESRLQRSPGFPIHHPGAMPQAGIEISAFGAKPTK